MPKLGILAFLILGVSISQISADKITLDFFKDKPRSFIKDFYISEYLKKDIDPKDADSLIGDVNNMNYPLFYKFADKGSSSEFKRVKYCLTLKAKLFDGKSTDCIAIGLSLYKATKIEPKVLTNIAKTVYNEYPKLSKKYNIIASKSFKKLIKSENNILINTFISVGRKFRKEYFNYTIPEKKLISLSKDLSFSKMITKIVRDKNLDKLQKSILKIDSSKLSSDANFLLAINAIKHSREDVAIWYLKLSEQKAKIQDQKDRAIFWQYLLKKDKKTVSKLLKSKEINIYTLYAHQELGVKYKKIYTTIQPKNKKAPFDIKDPFAWINTKRDFKNTKYKNYNEKKLNALKLNSDQSEPHVSTLIYRFKDDEHYFLKPYFNYLKDLPKKRATLILAIARQESKFIPTAVSYSYALGLMQFMPFVAKDIATDNNITNFKYEDLFDPKIAYKFANIHLDFLEKSLYHPLFIAYAYNGGIGFTKRQILTKEYFKDDKYEPFMSIEMVPNPQAREYGKKVLTNYVVYANLLDIKKSSIKELLQTLKPPYHMHCF